MRSVSHLWPPKPATGDGTRRRSDGCAIIGARLSMTSHPRGSWSFCLSRLTRLKDRNKFQGARDSCPHSRRACPASSSSPPMRYLRTGRAQTAAEGSALLRGASFSHHQLRPVRLSGYRDKFRTTYLVFTPPFCATRCVSCDRAMRISSGGLPAPAASSLRRTAAHRALHRALSGCTRRSLRRGLA